MRFKDFFTPSRWKSFVTWLLKLIVRKLDNSEIYLEPYEVEQYMFRLLRCPECVNKGKCIHCGCDTIGRMMNRTDECSDGRWGNFLSKEMWEQYKKDFEVRFTLYVLSKKL